MREAASGLGQKALALAVLAIAAWILLKVVVGFVMGIAWIAVIIAAGVAVIWSLAKLNVL